MQIVSNIAAGIGSLVLCAGGMSLIAMLGTFAIDPRPGCNPYGVFPCRCRDD